MENQPFPMVAVRFALSWHLPAILGKDDIKAFQASERTGVLYTKIRGSRVELAGKAALYSIGELVFPLEVK